MYPVTVGVAIETRELWDEVQSSLQGMPVRVLLEQREIGHWPALLQRIENLQPEIVLLDITRLPNPLEEAVRSIRSSSGQPMVVALHTSAEPETILAAVRAGANEYLYPPLAENLRKALERKSEERNRSRESVGTGAKILGFFSAKGGCGATTLACHFAAELGRLSAPRNQHALLADLDLEAGLVGFLMQSKSSYSVLDAVHNLHRLDLSYWRGLISNGWQGLEIIAAPGDFSPRRPVEYQPFREVLAFVRLHYEWTVVDLGRSLNPLTLSALEEIDQAYLVATLDVPALHQAKQIVQTLRHRGYGRERLRVILNRAPQCPEMTSQELEKMLGAPVEAMLPDNYSALYDSYCAGKLLPPGSHLGRQIARLAARAAGVPEEKGKRRFALFG